jgi:hypothetical protein
MMTAATAISHRLGKGFNVASIGAPTASDLTAKAIPNANLHSQAELAGYSAFSITPFLAAHPCSWLKGPSQRNLDGPKLSFFEESHGHQ